MTGSTDEDTFISTQAKTRLLLVKHSTMYIYIQQYICMKCFEIKSRLPCNLSLHHACSNRRAYRQYILDTRVNHNLFMCFLHHIHPKIKTNLLESPYILLLLEGLQEFYFIVYSTCTCILHLFTRCIFAIVFFSSISEVELSDKTRCFVPCQMLILRPRRKNTRRWK